MALTKKNTNLTDASQPDTRLKSRGGYGNIGKSMDALEAPESEIEILKRQLEEAEEKAKERDQLVAELEARKAKEHKKVKLQIYVDEDLNATINKNSKKWSREVGGKSAYVSHLIRKALESED